MARSSMAALISRLRLLINDPAGGSQVFTDDQLQAGLDDNRTSVRYAPLVPAATVAPGGGVTYKNYSAAGLGDWEDDVVLVDGAYTVLVPTTSDLQTGEWVFSSGQNPPVLLTGKTYDLYAAAADMLDRRLALTAPNYAFAAAGQTFQANQEFDMWLRLRDSYRAQQRSGAGGGSGGGAMGAIPLVVSDVPGGWWGGY